MSTVTAAPRGRELSGSRLAGYALPSLSLAFLGLPVTTFLPAFYAATLHVDLAVVGVFLLASRSLDVVVDPLIGKWSDSTPARFGRRRPFMWIGALLIMVGVYFLFTPPIAPNGWYLMLASVVTYCGGSCLGLSYSAWGTEIVESYHGRSRMAAFQGTAVTIGTMLAASIPWIAARHGVDRFTMSIFAWMVVVLTPLTVLSTILAVGKVPVRVLQMNPPWLKSIAALWANRPFRILCAAYFLFGLALSIPGSIMVFFVTNYLGRPDLIGPAFIIQPICTMASIPFWLAIARRVGKHRAIVYSLLVALTIFSCGGLLLRPGQGWWFVALRAAVELASGGFNILPAAILGDVIDYDMLLHRQVRGGMYWGVWAFAQKLAPALGIGIALPFLKLCGFDPGGHSTPEGLQALRYTLCLGIVPFFVVGAILMLKFPLNARRHEIIRRRLDLRSARSAGR